MNRSDNLPRVTGSLALASPPPAMLRGTTCIARSPVGATYRGTPQECSFMCACDRHQPSTEPSQQRPFDACETQAPSLLFAKCYSSCHHANAPALSAEQLHACNGEPEPAWLLGSCVEESLRAMLLDRDRRVRELCLTLADERSARAQAEAKAAGREAFLAMLGHDLLSPLHAILGTAHLISLQRELGPKGLAALARIGSSGVRMQRMIEQIRDVTRTQFGLGLSVFKQSECDVALLVANIVNEIRAANARCSIDFDESAACRAAVDGDRFEQVASNLITNAVLHGDTQRPITVTLEVDGDQFSFSVHNYGLPIETDQIPLLFDAFKRSERGETRRHSEGLGLGLHIVDSIVRAHGGQIQVSSSSELGTRFRAILPIHERESPVAWPWESGPAA